MMNAPSTTATRTPPQRRSRKPGAPRRLLPWALGALLVLLIGWGLRPQPTEVELGEVRTGPLVVTVLEEGKTRIRHRYVISAPITGLLQRVEFRAGAAIEAGKTVLAVLESQPSSFLDPRARTEAEARVQAAEALRLQRDSQAERIRSSLQLAGKELARAAELKRSGAIAAREWDTAENQTQVLARELRAAEFGRQVADFELAQARAALSQAESAGPGKGEPFRIVAPVSGFVLSVMEESARVVAPGTPIMEVGDPHDLEAEIELLSSDAVGVQPGAEVSIEQWGGDAPLRGRVSVVEPGGYTKVSALGVEEQRVKVRVEFVDPLPSGRSLGDRFRVAARVVTWRGENVLQIPTAALFRRGGDWMTFRHEGGKARRIKVDIGHNNGLTAEVMSGVSAGDQVLVHPPDAITDGAPVRPAAHR